MDFLPTCCSTCESQYIIWISHMTCSTHSACSTNTDHHMTYSTKYGFYHLCLPTWLSHWLLYIIVSYVDVWWYSSASLTYNTSDLKLAEWLSENRTTSILIMMICTLIGMSPCCQSADNVLKALSLLTTCGINPLCHVTARDYVAGYKIPWMSLSNMNYVWIHMSYFINIKPCFDFINRCYCTPTCYVWTRKRSHCSGWCTMHWDWGETSGLSLWPKHCRLFTLWGLQCPLPDHLWVQLYYWKYYLF